MDNRNINIENKEQQGRENQLISRARNFVYGAQIEVV
jgi:hypothetical protein